MDKDIIKLIQRAQVQDDGYFELVNEIAQKFPKKLYEQLYQLVLNPTWDGHIISKSDRGELFELGIAVRVCAYGGQGYTASRYIGYSILRSAKELGIYDCDLHKVTEMLRP